MGIKPTTIRNYAIAALLFGLFFAFLAPQASMMEFTLGNRFIFFLASFVIGWTQGGLIAYGVRKILSPERFAGWQLMLISAVVATGPLMLEIPPLWDYLKISDRPSNDLLRFFHSILIVNLICFSSAYALIEKWPWGRVKPDADTISGDAGESLVEAPVADNPNVSMLARRPDGLHGDVLALSAEDHYLRVHCETKSALVLYRLSDAIRDLDGADGMKVHRSWWVSRTAVRNVQFNGRGGELELVNGQKVPVSRSNVRALRAAGWDKLNG